MARRERPLVAATALLILGEAFNPCDGARGQSDCGNEESEAYLLFFPMTATLIGAGVIARRLVRHFWASRRVAD